MSVKIEAELDIPLFRMLALIYEVELHTKWIPMLSESKELKRPNKACKIFYEKFNFLVGANRENIQVF